MSARMTKGEESKIRCMAFKSTARKAKTLIALNVVRRRNVQGGLLNWLPPKNHRFKTNTVSGQAFLKSFRW